MKPRPKEREAYLDETLTLDQLAERWNMPRKDIRHLLGRQELAFAQIRGKFRIAIEEIERYEKEQRKA